MCWQIFTDSLGSGLESWVGDAENLVEDQFLNRASRAADAVRGATEDIASVQAR